jgi:hypothetical protein
MFRRLSAIVRLGVRFQSSERRLIARYEDTFPLDLLRAGSPSVRLREFTQQQEKKSFAYDLKLGADSLVHPVPRSSPLFLGTLLLATPVTCLKRVAEPELSRSQRNVIAAWGQQSR